MSNKNIKSEPTPSGPEVVSPRKRMRKSPDQRFQISWLRLQAMDISYQAKQEMITKGIAEPDPATKRINSLPVEVRAQAGSMISSVATFNKQHGEFVTARVMFTTVKQEEAPAEADSTVSNQ